MWIPVLLLLALTACTDSSPEAGVSAVDVSLAATMVVGERQVVSASISSTSVGAVPSATVSWESSDLSVVRVDAGGKAEAVGAGSAFITGRASGVSGTARISVVPVASGTWTGAIVRDTCLEPPGCYFAPLPREVYDGRLTLTQRADQVEGEFTTGRIPIVVSGRVDTSGVISLSGEGRKFLDDGRLWVYIGIRSWSTTLRDGRLAGEAVTAKQELGKGGINLSSLVTARGPVELR